MASGIQDLTRWNRAGLSRLTYVDGNAVSFFELLRAASAERFPEWRALSDDLPADPSAEPAAVRLERILHQYAAERGDWGLEIARVLARACHVLTGHLDAYANEGFLGTATQWDNVRRLVEMLDYHPAPPASAATLLALTARDAGLLEHGFQVQHVPPEGGAPVVFETLEDLEVDPRLDRLRPMGWNRSPSTFREAAPKELRAVASQPIRGLQGVGPAYGRWLDGLRQTETGDPASRFTFADLQRIDPASIAPAAFAAIGEPTPTALLRLRELKGKVELVLGFSWRGAEIAPLLGWTPAEALAVPAAELAVLTSRSAGEMEQLQAELSPLEIALDHSLFTSLRLRELAGDEDSAMPAPVWIAPEKPALSVGGLGLVVRDPGTVEAVVVTVDRLDPVRGILALRDASFQREWRDWTRGETSLQLRPAQIRRPRLNGPDTVAFDGEVALDTEEVVAWQSSGTWFFSRVVESGARALRLSGGRPDPGTEIFRAVPIRHGGTGLLFPDSYRVAVRASSTSFLQLTASDFRVVESETGRYRELTLSDVVEIYLVPLDTTPVGRTEASTAGEWIFDGAPGALATGQWAIVEDGEALWPLRIARIVEREDHFALSFEAAASAPRATGHRAVGDRLVTDLQGIGPAYAAALSEVGVYTLADLFRLELTSLARLSGINAVRRWEFKVKAEVVLGLERSAFELAPLLDETAIAVLQTPDEDLAERLSAPLAEVASLKDDLRLIEACLVETAFNVLPIRDLVPGPSVGARLAPAAFSSSSSAPASLPERILRLHGLFGLTLRPDRWNRNDTPLTGVSLALDIADVPRSLARRRRVLLERVLERETDEGFVGTRALSLREVDPESRTVTLDLAPLTAADGYTVGNTVLRANVVLAGHGEARPEKVLGSGDATQLRQRFVLAETGVSFVADPAQPSGVRADVEVRVADAIWQQVANLRSSAPADPHYAVRLTEQGYLAVEFGDGRNGRRLPTGTNNVRVRYRVGAGLGGNLPAGRLVRPVRPHRLVESVRQPLPATGGNDLEPARSLRRNAPASVLTLERAVSVADFGRLAGRQSSVWQARAFARPAPRSRNERIEVVVVPAGGGPLGALGETLRQTLAAHALPGVDVIVSAAEQVAFRVQVAAQIRSAEHEPALVLAAVREALFAAFSLERRRLGQDLFLSEVVQVVEGVVGVESSRCEIGAAPSAGRSRLEATERQVFHLDRATSEIELGFEEFRL